MTRFAGLMWRFPSSHASQGNISISDGHAVVEVREYRCMTYHTKNFCYFPYIQLDILKSGHFNRKLLSEVICHDDFLRLMTDMKIFIDSIVNTQIDNLNRYIGTCGKLCGHSIIPMKVNCFTALLN